MNRIKKNMPLIIVASSIMMAFILIITKPDEAKIEVEKFIPKINTLLMKPQDFSLFINSEGYIKSIREFPLLPEVSGKVLYLSAYFNNNLIFDRGDTLVRIDSTNYSIARRNAKAKRDVARLENLQQKAIKERSKTELGNYNDSKVSDLAKKIPQLQSSNSLLDAAEANYDNAELNIEKGNIVLTTDAIIEGVHFPKSEDPKILASRIIRVNLSDIAAMGAVPRAYLLVLALPSSTTLKWIESFVEGLSDEQKEFRISLIGGDTTHTHSELMLSITMIGEIYDNNVLLRSGARIGDYIYVSGFIGDAALGLSLIHYQL